MADLQNHRSGARARHSDRAEVALLRRELAFTRRALWELGSRVESLPRYRFSFRLELTVAEAVELLLRRLPDRAYNWLHWHCDIDDYRVRLGRPYRRRERRERRALLKRFPWAMTVREFSEVCAGYWDGSPPPLDIDAELARVRSELDSEFTS